jgi:Mitochondrial ribosomal protein L27
MVRPSPALSARLRLTTKQVSGGYYKGNRTGSMGAHTEWGGYVIDYRKVRNYNCPDLRDLRDSKVRSCFSPRSPIHHIACTSGSGQQANTCQKPLAR